MTSIAEQDPAPTELLYAALETGAGRIVVQLFEQEAPRAVAHFVGLATGRTAWTHPADGRRHEGRPLYDNTSAHAAAPLFAVQWGDPFSSVVDGDPSRLGQGDVGVRVEPELHPSLRFDRPGLMALGCRRRADGVLEAGCQFFLTEVALPHLDRAHAVVGEVVRGFERLPKVARHAEYPVPGAPAGPIALHRVVVTRGSY